MIKVHNDGKEKAQSFRASITMLDGDIFEIGYGKNEKEAMDNLRASIVVKMVEINNKFDYILDNFYAKDVEYVDYFGNRIK